MNDRTIALIGAPATRLLLAASASATAAQADGDAGDVGSTPEISGPYFFNELPQTVFGLEESERLVLAAAAWGCTAREVARTQDPDLPEVSEDVIERAEGLRDHAMVRGWDPQSGADIRHFLAAWQPGNLVNVTEGTSTPLTDLPGWDVDTTLLNQAFADTRSTPFTSGETLAEIGIFLPGCELLDQAFDQATTREVTYVEPAGAGAEVYQNALRDVAQLNAYLESKGAAVRVMLVNQAGCPESASDPELEKARAEAALNAAQLEAAQAMILVLHEAMRRTVVRAREDGYIEPTEECVLKLAELLDPAENMVATAPTSARMVVQLVRELSAVRAQLEATGGQLATAASIAAHDRYVYEQRMAEATQLVHEGHTRLQETESRFQGLVDHWRGRYTDVMAGVSGLLVAEATQLPVLVDVNVTPRTVANTAGGLYGVRQHVQQAVGSRC